MRRTTIVAAALVAAGLAAAPARAAWRPADAGVAAAAKDADVAAVLAQVDLLDAALLGDDHAAFASRLAPDLVVNNPQNGISRAGATSRRNAAGRISYARYDRIVEYAGRLGDMVLLMGEERVLPKGDSPGAGHEVRRRFTDLWRRTGGRWLLAARQATVIGIS